MDLFEHETLLYERQKYLEGSFIRSWFNIDSHQCSRNRWKTLTAS